MAVFIELVTDAFEEVFSDRIAERQNLEGGRASRAGKALARRPLRGIEIKDDTYASLKVVLANGKEWPLLDSSSPDGVSKKGYTNFILQQVSEQRMEKHQIVETFGDSYVFFFGEAPRFLDCTAILVNTLDFNWRAEWWHNYENYLRGTKLVELGARCYMFWDDIIVEGYILNAQAAEQSEQPYTVSLQFKFFVTKYQNISLVNVEQYPIRSSVVLPEGVELTSSDAFDRLQQYYQGTARDDRAQDAAPREGEVVQSAADRNELNNISQKVRQMPNSMVVDPEVWNKLMGVRGFATPDKDFVAQKMAGVTGQLRGKIAQNIDEYAGAPGSGSYNSQLSTPEDLSQRGDPDWFKNPYEESDDLTNDTINTLEDIGCAADNPNTVRDLGLGPNFSPSYRSNSVAYAGFGTGFSAGVGAGAGASVSFGGSASASASVSFGVVANASASAGVGAGVGVSARAGYYANSSAAGASAQYSHSYYRTQDPLGNVYGRSSTEVYAFNADARLTVEGAGDYQYGYRSAYGRVGYGRAGYGDFGGTGFGGCNAYGDPGYIDPYGFSNQGVGQNQAAFDAWVRPRPDGTAVTRGPIFGGTAVTGGASIEVGGRSSAFAMVAVDGEFEPWVVQESETVQDGDIGGIIQTERRTSTRTVSGPGYFSAEASASVSLF